MIWTRDKFIVSDEKDLLNIEFVHHYLSQKSYWSANIPFEVVKKSIEGSMCFGVYKEETQIGFARIITDKATIAYLGDVFIDEEYRGLGLSKWLMEIIIKHDELQSLRRWMLITRDAHELYKKYGFTPIGDASKFMHRHNPDVYAGNKTNNS
ncbi:MAG TPA: GNAT family N-acetyltransferase [Puia sp.]|nr:GNAT family N-acetyltransferase [Puia sp.]